MFNHVNEAEVAAKQREIFNRERQLEIEQEALDAAIEANRYDGEALMYRVYYPKKS